MYMCVIKKFMQCKKKKSILLCLCLCTVHVHVLHVVIDFYTSVPIAAGANLKFRYVRNTSSLSIFVVEILHVI